MEFSRVRSLGWEPGDVYIRWQEYLLFGEKVSTNCVLLTRN